jgi:hypothetical protein
MNAIRRLEREADRIGIERGSEPLLVALPGFCDISARRGQVGDQHYDALPFETDVVFEMRLLSIARARGARVAIIGSGPPRERLPGESGVRVSGTGLPPLAPAT